MKKITSTSIILIVLSICTFGQAAAVKLQVKIPADSTRISSGVFVAGSFNGWNPHDSLYLMTKTGEDLYSLEIPVFLNKKYEYKYTQGGWGTVELSDDSYLYNKNHHLLGLRKHLPDHIFIARYLERFNATILESKRVATKNFYCFARSHIYSFI